MSAQRSVSSREVNFHLYKSISVFPVFNWFDWSRKEIWVATEERPARMSPLKGIPSFWTVEVSADSQAEIAHRQLEEAPSHIARNAIRAFFCSAFPACALKEMQFIFWHPKCPVGASCESSLFFPHSNDKINKVMHFVLATLQISLFCVLFSLLCFCFDFFCNTQYILEHFYPIHWCEGKGSVLASGSW